MDDVGLMLQAEIARGKASGFYVRKVEVAKPAEVETIDEAALRRRIIERAARLGYKMIPVAPELISK